ncbi:hypothetical protein SRB5_66180 [Streptomyces sp. RB5]|uniref:DUF397 domain-containing protein n=1 Tax=Streptomyces smaragdinus TaxID=2585196 RepID=A0A7K0CSH0_9ACTN|nr:DUF397 domain-containing protein [Streptomyces smaragdinus]MQY16419.1 hypothetical protein [Streptomyces smaragdinus]
MTDHKRDLYAMDLTDAVWHKASESGAENNCVEITELPDGARAIRDSKNPDRQPLCFTASEWAAFRTGITTGEL